MALREDESAEPERDEGTRQHTAYGMDRKKTALLLLCKHNLTFLFLFPASSISKRSAVYTFPLAK